MTDAERREAIVATLIIVVDELNKGAAGPCDYWYRQLAERLLERAKKIMEFRT